MHMRKSTIELGNDNSIMPHFLYSCKLCFQFTTLYYMHHKGKKESEKEILKKKKKKVTKNLLKGDCNLDPHNQLELKVNASIHWTTSR